MRRVNNLLFISRDHSYLVGYICTYIYTHTTYVRIGYFFSTSTWENPFTHTLCILLLMLKKFTDPEILYVGAELKKEILKRAFI